MNLTPAATEAPRVAQPGRDLWTLRGLVDCGTCGGLMLAVMRSDGRAYSCGRCPRFVVAEWAEQSTWERFARMNEALAAAVVPERRGTVIREVVQRVVVVSDALDLRCEWRD